MNTAGGTLLQYELSTSPDPPRASSPAGDIAHLTLTIVANLPAALTSMMCEAVSIEFDIGQHPCTDASYLTCDGTGMTASAPVEAWRLATAADGTFTFVRPTGVDPTVVQQGYAFEISGIAVSPTVGTATVTVREWGHSTSSEPPAWRTTTFDVPKFPPSFRPLQFRAHPPAVSRGDTVVLSWSRDSSADYHLSVNDGPAFEVTGDSWPSGHLTQSTSFELTVTTESDGVTLTRRKGVQVLVSVEQLELEGDKDTILSGDGVTFTWVADQVTDLSLVADAEGSRQKRTSVDAQPVTASVVHPVSTTSYFLEGRTRSGALLQSTPYRVTVLPRAEPAVSDLYLVTTSRTTGAVALTVASGGSGFSELRQASSGIAAAELNHGSWSLCQCDTDPGWMPDLVLIKTTGTPAGFVERHVAFRKSLPGKPMFSYVMASPTPFPESWGAHGMWFPDSPAGLFFIQREGTADGRVWVHFALVGAVRIQSSVATPCPVDRAMSGTWAIAGVSGGQRADDLVFVQTSGTNSGMVEVSYWTSASGFQKGDVQVTGFDCDEAGSGTWHLAEMEADGPADLVFVKTRNTVGAVAEIYHATASSRYRQVQGGYTSLTLTEIADGHIGVGRYYHPRY